MKRFGNLVLIVFAAIGLVLAYDYATFADDGDSLILGRVNDQTSPTTLTTVKGPALSLRAHSKSQPVLAVSNSRLIYQLNADEVDGLDGNRLRNDTHVYTFTSTGPQPAGTKYVVPQVPAGSYLAGFSALLRPNAGDQTGASEIACHFQVGSKQYAWDGTLYDEVFPASLSGSDVIKLKTASDVALVCAPDTDVFHLSKPIRVSLTTTHLSGVGSLTQVFPPE